MKREYPSTPEEAFQQSVEGAYYAKQFHWLYANGRIGQIPANPHLPVHTFWDIGVGDSTAIWFVREVGNDFHIIDHYENSGEGLRHYMKVLKDRGYTYGEHWGPHDIENREFGSDAKSRKELARDGYEIDGQRYSIKFNVVPRESVDTGIEAVREILPFCVFDEAKCEQGINALEGYRKSGMTSAAAGKTNLCMTGHHTALMGSAISPSSKTTGAHSKRKRVIFSA